MSRLKEAAILRVYLGELDKRQGRPLYEAVTAAAREAGLAGATVFRGILGYGEDTLVHTAKILRLAEDLPVVVEIVDSPERVQHFLPVLDAMLSGGTYVVIPCQVVFERIPRVSGVMTRNPHTVRPDTPISDVVELLVSRGVKSVPVTQGEKILGIVTGGDLVSRGGLPLRLSLAPLLPGHVRDSHREILGKTGLSAADVMTSPARVVRETTPIAEAVSLMLKYGVKRFPVVDDKGHLTGVVARADLLRCLSGFEIDAAPTPEMAATLALAARDAMIPEVPTASPDTPMAVVIERLLTSPLERVVVIDGENRVSGIILDVDILRCFAKQEDPGFFKTLVRAFSKSQPEPLPVPGVAADVMRREVYSVCEDDPLLQVMRVITRTQAKRLTVTTRDGHLAGMIDRERLLRALGRRETELLETPAGEA